MITALRALKALILYYCIYFRFNFGFRIGLVRYHDRQPVGVRAVLRGDSIDCFVVVGELFGVSWLFQVCLAAY